MPTRYPQRPRVNRVAEQHLEEAIGVHEQIQPPPDAGRLIREKTQNGAPRPDYNPRVRTARAIDAAPIT